LDVPDRGRGFLVVADELIHVPPAGARRGGKNDEEKD
jgi:hypothetical protein